MLEPGQISIVDYRYVVEAQIPTKKATIIENIISFVGLFLLFIKGWNTIVLVSGSLPLWKGWHQNGSKGKPVLKLLVTVRGSRTFVLKFPIKEIFFELIKIAATQMTPTTNQW